MTEINSEAAKPEKGNILVVDDTPVNLRLLVNILSQNHYKVRPVPNGELALSAARGLPPDLILLDINMPDMNGYEVCEQLKADEKTRDVPVIFLSALNDVLDKVKAFGAGGVDYITKPFQVEEVLARVETHLAMRFLQADLKEKNENLTKTLEQLKKTQNQLIQSEKMAALGQLIAGIAHEVNNPLASIRSSVHNLADFLEKSLFEFPQFFYSLSAEIQQEFLTLLQKSSQQATALSTKEKRQLRKALIRQLEERAISNAESIADTLVDLGAGGDIEPFLPLLHDPNSPKILQVAYQLASLKKSTANITTATERAAKIVFALKNYARYDAAGEKVLANIAEGVETVLTLYQNQLKRGVEVIRNYEAELPLVPCYPDELNQVWTNLVHNALQAMEYRGTLTIDVRQQEGNILVSISDSGKGIPPEILPRIFEPFFTTKPAGEGSGLGLDIVRKIIDKHCGTIGVESVPNQTIFTVCLPLHETF